MVKLSCVDSLKDEEGVGLLQRWPCFFVFFLGGVVFIMIIITPNTPKLIAEIWEYWDNKIKVLVTLWEDIFRAIMTYFLIITDTNFSLL